MKATGSLQPCMGVLLNDGIVLRWPADCLTRVHSTRQLAALQKPPRERQKSVSCKTANQPQQALLCGTTIIAHA